MLDKAELQQLVDAIKAANSPVLPPYLIGKNIQTLIHVYGGTTLSTPQVVLAANPNRIWVLFGSNSSTFTNIIPQNVTGAGNSFAVVNTFAPVTFNVATDGVMPQLQWVAQFSGTGATLLVMEQVYIEKG